MKQKTKEKIVINATLILLVMVFILLAALIFRILGAPIPERVIFFLLTLVLVTGAFVFFFLMTLKEYDENESEPPKAEQKS